MMFALISPNETIVDWDNNYLGVRVAQVEAQSFDVAAPLFWVECDDNCVPQECYYANNAIHQTPPPPQPRDEE